MMWGILHNYYLPCFFEIGSLTGPGARLAASDLVSTPNSTGLTDVQPYLTFYVGAGIRIQLVMFK